MEEDRAESPASPRQTNIAQRLGRQISRAILPALRNIVRSNRSPRPRAADPDSSTAVPSSPSPSPHSPSPVSLDSQGNHLPTDPFNCTEPQQPSDISLPPLPPLPSLPSLPPLSPLRSHSLPPLPPLRSPSRSPRSSSLPPPPPPLPIPSLPDPASPPNDSALQLVNNLEALSNLSNLPSLSGDQDSMDTNTTTDSSNNMDTSTDTSNARQRYRLVVYFEERSVEEQPTARYVAVIVGRLDELQFLLSSNSSERSFGDILNNLFNAYAPKGTPPASKSSIDSLPTVTISGEQEQSCMICLEAFAEGSTAVVLPCKHMFHGEECVKSWLKLHNSCPICRYELPVEDAEYEATRKERMVARGFDEGQSQADLQQDDDQRMEADEASHHDHHDHDHHDHDHGHQVSEDAPMLVDNDEYVNVD